MSRFRKAVLATALLAVAGFAGAQTASKYPGVGRAATPKEVAAWDIDVRPDFKGLPAGSGSVAKGQDVWEGKCAQCHGIFAESGEVFAPLVGVGAITKEDIKTGHASKLKDNTYPGRPVFMKLATLSTLWDYINRAMPWTAPKSLSTEEVYAVTAYLLNLATIVPDDFVLSDKNIAEVQKLMPNRNGMDPQHNMWPGREFSKVTKSDTSNVACMKDCVPEAKVASFLPDYARNAHGNLAEQNRLVGAQHGADTTKPEAKSAQGAVAPAVVAQAPVVVTPASKSEPAGVDSKAAMALTQKYSCTACHSIDKKIIGPSFMDIAKKHAGKADYLAGKLKSGGVGVWGSMPMPAQTLSDAEAKTIGAWLASGAGK